MTYDVVFDVSQRIPQLGVGIVAAAALALVGAIAMFRIDLVLARWPIIVGVGGGLLILQWLIVDAWPYAVAATILLTVVVVLSQSDAIKEAPPGPLPRGSRRTMLGTILLVLVAFFGLPMVSAIDLARRLDAGETTVLQGPISFQSFGKTECLTVDHSKYCYSEAEVTPGYNRRQYLVGAIADNTQVRISVIDDLIVRLEVAASPGQ